MYSRKIVFGRVYVYTSRVPGINIFMCPWRVYVQIYTRKIAFGSGTQNIMWQMKVLAHASRRQLEQGLLEWSSWAAPVFSLSHHLLRPFLVHGLCALNIKYLYLYLYLPFLSPLSLSGFSCPLSFCSCSTLAPPLLYQQCPILLASLVHCPHIHPSSSGTAHAHIRSYNACTALEPAPTCMLSPYSWSRQPDLCRVLARRCRGPAHVQNADTCHSL
jgi:hypothetical protein